MSLMAILLMGAGKPSPKYVNESIAKAAKEVSVPVELLKAICTAESNLKTDSYVHSDGGNNNHAFGICQVLLNTAGDYGFKDERCREDYRKRHSERVYSTCKLFGPFTNALYAGKYLKSKLDKYNGSWINAIAAYNSGSIKVCPKEGFYMSYRDGIKRLDKPRKVSCIPGELLNRKYVDRVLKAMGRK